MLTIEVLGCGEALSNDLGNTAFLLQLHQNKSPKIQYRALIDCGYQIPERFFNLPKAKQQIDALFFTHYHADHCFGFPALLVRFWEEKRTKPLNVYGPSPLRKHLEGLCKLGYPSILKKIQFSIRWVELNPTLKNTLLFSEGCTALTLNAAFTQHTRRCLAYRFDLKSGPNSKLKNRSIAISGDGAMTRDSIELFKPANLVFHECFWMKRPKGVVGIHTSFDELFHYIQTHPKQTVILTHAARSQRSKIMAACRAQNTRQIQIAKPGQTSRL